MEEESEAATPREAQGMTPVADFAKLSVSAGTLERQEVSTPPVLSPVLEQAAPADVEMAAAEPEEGDVLGHMQLMFGKLKKQLTPGEKARLEELRKQWAKQEKQTKIAEYQAKVLEKQDEKREKAACLAQEHKQQWEKSVRIAEEQDAQLERDTQLQALKEEATHHAFADVPVDSEQERTSDEDLAQQ